MPSVARAEGSGQSMRARIAGLSAEAAAQSVLDCLLEEIAGILKQSRSVLDINRPIAELGIDSLMSVELHAGLEARMGVQLPLMTLTGANTLRTMSGKLLQRLLAEETTTTDGLAGAILRHEGEPEVALDEAAQ
jgi:acyl carrier protein